MNFDYVLAHSMVCAAVSIFEYQMVKINPTNILKCFIWLLDIPFYYLISFSIGFSKYLNEIKKKRSYAVSVLSSNEQQPLKSFCTRKIILFHLELRLKSLKVMPYLSHCETCVIKSNWLSSLFSCFFFVYF